MLNLRPEVRAIVPEMAALRRAFHRQPELGLDTVKTADVVEKKLKSYGLAVRRPIKNGIVGLIKGGRPGKTLLIRADIDALPVTEQNAVPYKSRVLGKMHA